MLDAITNPDEYTDTLGDTCEWKWDTETRTKAIGLKTTFTNFSTICTFVITMNLLNGSSLQGLAAKLQRRDHDVFHAFQLINNTLTELKSIRTNIDSFYPIWYDQAVELAASVDSEPTRPRTIGRQIHRYLSILKEIMLF